MDVFTLPWAKRRCVPGSLNQVSGPGNEPEPDQ